MVEDNRADVRLMQEGLEDAKVQVKLHVVETGEAALDRLRLAVVSEAACRPDLILLDLGLPRMSGQEVLAEIKSDADLRLIPVIILTTSEAEQDILESYGLNANCYITKPIDPEQFLTVVRAMNDFWLTFVKLPPIT